MRPPGSTAAHALRVEVRGEKPAFAGQVVHTHSWGHGSNSPSIAATRCVTTAVKASSPSRVFLAADRQPVAARAGVHIGERILSILGRERINRCGVTVDGCVG